MRSFMEAGVLLLPKCLHWTNYRSTSCVVTHQIKQAKLSQSCCSSFKNVQLTAPRLPPPSKASNDLFLQTKWSNILSWPQAPFPQGEVFDYSATCDAWLYTWDVARDASFACRETHLSPLHTPTPHTPPTHNPTQTHTNTHSSCLSKHFGNMVMPCEWVRRRLILNENFFLFFLIKACKNKQV